MSDICVHGDLLDCCLDCTVAPPKPGAVAPIVGMHVFIASFAGHCSDCEFPIKVGENIARMSDGTYRHRDCVDEWAR